MWQSKYILNEMGSSLHCPSPFVTDGNPPVKLLINKIKILDAVSFVTNDPQCAETHIIYMLMCTLSTSKYDCSHLFEYKEIHLFN